MIVVSPAVEAYIHSLPSDPVRLFSQRYPTRALWPIDGAYDEYNMEAA